jgi:hypothetical protein
LPVLWHLPSDQRCPGGQLLLAWLALELLLLELLERELLGLERLLLELS